MIFKMLKPTRKRRVKDPVTMEVLHGDGERKPMNAYWARRLLDGDVVEVRDLSATDTEKETIDESDEVGEW